MAKSKEIKYKPTDDYCSKAVEYQSVPTEAEARAKLLSEGKAAGNAEIRDFRGRNKYPCNDSYRMGTIKDDHIFISTSDKQHRQIIKGEKPTEDGGISGYFSDQATVDDCRTSVGVDNTQFNRKTQVYPKKFGDGDIRYKPHIDCFTIDYDALEKEYGTRDFNAAIAKCEANNQFGEGGGNQGYNPYLDQMIENGCLKYDKSQSYSDRGISELDDSEMNPNTLVNSTVDEDTFDKMNVDKDARIEDCISNNTNHPSKEIVDTTGFEHNPNPVKTPTGNAVDTGMSSSVSSGVKPDGPEMVTEKNSTLDPAQTLSTDDRLNAPQPDESKISTKHVEDATKSKEASSGILTTNIAKNNDEAVGSSNGMSIKGVSPVQESSHSFPPALSAQTASETPIKESEETEIKGEKPTSEKSQDVEQSQQVNDNAQHASEEDQATKEPENKQAQKGNPSIDSANPEVVKEEAPKEQAPKDQTPADQTNTQPIQKAEPKTEGNTNTEDSKTQEQPKEESPNKTNYSGMGM